MEKGIDVEAKRLNLLLYWIQPKTMEDYSRMLHLGTNPYEPMFRRIDRWTEVLGPVLKLSWIRMEGIPSHEWDLKVFH